MPPSDATEQNAILNVLRECFYGAGDKGAFLDPGPNGLFALLKSLSAQEASLPVAGASIATHALHVAFSLDVFAQWIQGVRGVTYDWDTSWEKNEVSETEWNELLCKMEGQCLDLEQAIMQQAASDVEAMWGAAGALAHTAYHLGIIQVKIDALRKVD